MKNVLIPSMIVLLSIGICEDLAVAQYRVDDSAPDLNYNSTVEPESEFKTVKMARFRSIGYTLGTLVLGSSLVYSTDGGESSFVGTAGGLIALGGFIVGPSAGSIYADDWSRTIRGIIIRSGAFVTAAVGAVFVLDVAFGGNGSSGELGMIMVIGGTITGVGSMLYDTFFSSRNSVEEYNQRAKLRHGKTTVQLYPWMRGNFEGAGLSAKINF